MNVYFRYRGGKTNMFCSLCTFGVVLIKQYSVFDDCSAFGEHLTCAEWVRDMAAVILELIVVLVSAEKALSKMGSSVFHGGFSTFVSLSVLAPSKTYIFIVFYKMWFGIILFGMANGFLLLPVILSYFGTI